MTIAVTVVFGALVFFVLGFYIYRRVLQQRKVQQRKVMRNKNYNRQVKEDYERQLDLQSNQVQCMTANLKILNERVEEVHKKNRKPSVSQKSILPITKKLNKEYAELHEKFSQEMKDLAAYGFIITKGTSLHELEKMTNKLCARVLYSIELCSMILTRMHALIDAEEIKIASAGKQLDEKIPIKVSPLFLEEKLSFFVKKKNNFNGLLPEVKKQPGFVII